MIIIKVFSSFCSSLHAMNVYITRYNLNNDPDYNIKYKFTINDDYTHVFILNTAMPDLTIPKENVIGFALEPLEFLGLSNTFINYAIIYIGKYYIGDIHIPCIIKQNKKENNIKEINSFIHLSTPFIEHYTYMFHTVPLTKEIYIKNTLMSIIFSEKQILNGHNYRYMLVEEILKLNLPIDIYGRGCRLYLNNNNRIKGEFNNELIPYQNYKFHIAIENTQTPHYFSEKITNPLLCNTNVLYLGCKNINKYFNIYLNNGIYLLTGNLEEDIKTIINICHEPSKYYKNIDIENIINVICIKKNIINQLI